MEFEWDPGKSTLNARKHGVDFRTATAIWRDENHVEIRARLEEAEGRFLVIGLIGPKLFAAIITYRASRIRIISVRRARDNEVALYESEEI